jgi:hypothetical protein
MLLDLLFRETGLATRWYRSIHAISFVSQTRLMERIKASGNRDITLHVTVDNPAMLLYQNFGFKTEKYM